MRLMEWWVCLDICVGWMLGTSIRRRLRRMWLQVVVARRHASIGVVEDMLWVFDV